MVRVGKVVAATCDNSAASRASRRDGGRRPERVITSDYIESVFRKDFGVWKFFRCVFDDGKGFSAVFCAR